MYVAHSVASSGESVAAASGRSSVSKFWFVLALIISIVDELMYDLLDPELVCQEPEPLPVLEAGTQVSTSLVLTEAKPDEINE